MALALRVAPNLSLSKYKGSGNHMVERLRYLEGEQTLFFNKIQRITLRIDGYQVVEKFLNSRKGRSLVLDEINLVGNRPASLTYREIDGPVTLSFERNARA